MGKVVDVTKYSNHWGTMSPTDSLMLLICDTFIAQHQRRCIDEEDKAVDSSVYPPYLL